MTRHPRATTRRGVTGRMVRWCGLLSVLALLLTACGLRQEITFNADGSGTASGSFAIDEDCASPRRKCSPWAEWLLKGEGPVVNATAAAASLPFPVRIGTLEDAEDGQIGYTLSFDFESVEDLERKLVPEADTPVESATHQGRTVSQTSPFTFDSITLAREEGRIVFSALAHLSPCGIGVDPASSFAVVLPGSPGENDADIVREVSGGTRFVWYMATEKPVGMEASALVPSRSAAWVSFSTAGGAAVLVAGLTALILTIVRRRARTWTSATPGIT